MDARVWAIAIAGAMTGCTFVQPEVGDRLDACVDADSDAARPVDFKAQIRPILDARCSNCHFYDQGTREGINATGLDLETRKSLLNGGVNTRPGIVVVGKPCSSAIVQKLRGTFPGARMPKNGPYLTREEIQLFMDWIAEGATGNDDD